MADLKQARRTLTVVAVVLLAADAAAVGFLLSPWGRSRSVREAEYNRVRSQLQETMVQVQPLRGIDGKLQLAKQDTAAFYAQRLPAASSAISAELGRLADHNAVRISAVQYEFKDADIQGLRQVMIQAKLSGSYPQEVKFINALERDKMFFILEGVSLGELQGGAVGLEMKMETYMKTGE